MDLELYVSLYVLSHPGHLHSSSSSSLRKQIREKEKKIYLPWIEKLF